MEVRLIGLSIGRVVEGLWSTRRSTGSGREYRSNAGIF